MLSETMTAALNKQIRASAKVDRRKRLGDKLAGESWKAIRELRRRPAIRPTAVRNEDGNAVASDTRT